MNLNLNEIIEHFRTVLEIKTGSYYDSFNDEIIRMLDLEEQDHSYLKNFFLTFADRKEIENWTNLVKHKLVMHEDEEGVDDLIFEYIEYQTRKELTYDSLKV